MQTQLQLGRYIHVCINEARSSKSTRFNLYFSRYNSKQHNPAKVGIKSCRFARECFIYAYIDVPTQMELCLHDQLDSYGLLLVSILFIVIPTPFLNFKFLFISSLFTFYCTIEPHLSALRLKT